MAHFPLLPRRGNASRTHLLSSLLPMSLHSLTNLARAFGPASLTTAVALVSAAVLLTGCATPGPDHAPLAQTEPAVLGLTQQATPETAALNWSVLGDARLSSLIEQSLQAHPSLAVARARVERAAALAQLNEAANGPQASLSSDVTRQRFSANGIYPAPLGGGTWNIANLQAGASWSPDFFGKHAAELAAALGQAKAAQADAAAAATGLSAQVARGYVALARLLAQREVAERTLAQREELQKLTRQRVDAGLDTKVEQVQAEGALPDTRVQIESLNEQIMLARHQLAVLAGLAPQALDALSPKLDAMALAQLPTVLGADLLGRRPDVVAARLRVEAAGQDVKVARTDFYPDINLTAFIGFNSLGLDQLFEAGSRQYGVQPALRLPLFDGGRLRAQLGAKQADLDASIAQYNGALLDAVREAADAMGSLASLNRQQAEQNSALQSAEKAYDLARQRHAAGLGNYLIVLNAESQLLVQRRAAVDLQARQLDSRVSLVKALGGGWAEQPQAVAQAATGKPGAP